MKLIFKRVTRPRFATLMVASFLIVNQSYAQLPGNTTPTEYIVSVSQVAFHKVGDPPNVFIPYAADAGQYNIASVSPHSNVGTLNATGTIQPGIYDEIQFIVSKTITLQGSQVLMDGFPCRTDSTGGVLIDPFGDGSVSAVAIGSRDGGPAQSQVITVPSGPGVPLPPELIDLGSSFKVILPVNFTITNAVPTVTVTFDVTNAMTLEGITDTLCVVYPQPPGINITVS